MRGVHYCGRRAYRHHRKRLRLQWEVPDSVYSLEGAEHLICRKGSQDLVPGTARDYAGAVIGNSYHAVGHGGPHPTLVNCKCGTAISLRQGRVAAADFRGSDCAAVRPARRPMRPPAPRLPFLSALAALCFPQAPQFRNRPCPPIFSVMPPSCWPPE